MKIIKQEGCGIQIAVSKDKTDIGKDVVNIALTPEEVEGIRDLFEKACFYEYIAANNDDWSDDKIAYVTERAYELYQESRQRADAEYTCIWEAEGEWNEKHETDEQEGAASI